MTDLTVVNPVVRVRIEAPADPGRHEMIARLGTIEHISQRRFLYVDVEAGSEEAALARARDAVAARVPADKVHVTTPNAPLDQPGSLPV